MLESESVRRSEPVRWLARLAIAGAMASCELVAPIPDLTSGVAALGDAATKADQAVQPEAAVDAKASTCPPTALYCNPFESSATLSDFVLDSSRLRLDPTTVSSGGSSLRVERESSKSGVVTLAPPKALPATLFVRVMAKIDNDSTILFLGHAAFTDGVQVYVVGSDVHLGKYNGDDVKADRSYDLALWHCVELGVDATQHTATMWIDDGPANTVSTAASTLPFEMLSLVVTAPTNTGSWYDDLVVDTQRVGCP